ARRPHRPPARALPRHSPAGRPLGNAVFCAVHRRSGGRLCRGGPALLGCFRAGFPGASGLVDVALQALALSARGGGSGGLPGLRQPLEAVRPPLPRAGPPDIGLTCAGAWIRAATRRNVPSGARSLLIMNLTIIGSGYVGLTTGACFAQV